jgi:hypothetical protein
MWLLLTDPAVIPLLTALYVTIGVACVLTNYTLNNEGLLTYYWASWLREEFAAVFFFQRTKPVLCLLYAPASAGGAWATLVAHTVVGATTIPMMAAIGRAVGLKLPNFPALAVALSPLYLLGGPAGVENVDGVTGITLVLYFLCVRRLPFAAGVVAGLLPWVRFEAVTFLAVPALYALLQKEGRPLLLGMAMFPLAYLGSGALYHHDMLWFVHFPPSTPFEPGNPIFTNQLVGLSYLLEPAAALTPVAALAVAVPFGRLTRIELMLLAYAIVMAVTMNVLAILHVGSYGDSPRYLLHLLPALALLVGRALEPWWDGERPSVASLLALALVIVWVATRQQDPRAVQILLVTQGLLLAAVCLRAGTVVAALAVTLVLVGPLLPLRTQLTQADTAKYLAPMAEWLEAHPQEGAGPIYTNAQLLAPFLEQHLPGADVHHMAAPDIAREQVLTNEANGQRDRLLRLAGTNLYGKTLWPPFTPDDFPANAIFALRNDARLPLVLPPDVWGPRLEMLVQTPDYQIARLRPSTAPR